MLDMQLAKFDLFRFTRKIGWPLLAFLCLVPAIRWMTLEPLSYSFGTPVATLHSIGKLSGLIGLTMYAFNLFLSTRIKFLENLFGGLNKVYIAHHLIGGLALVTLIAHPLALSLRLVPSSIESAADLLIPNLERLDILYGSIGFMFLVVLLIITFFINLPYKIWLLTHKFLGVGFAFVALHILFIPSDVTNDAFLHYWMIGVCVLGIASFVYRTLLPRIFVRRYDYILTHSELLKKDILRMHLSPKTTKNANFKPGQFVFIALNQDGFSGEFHPFSISSIDSSGNITITIKDLGNYTHSLVSSLPSAKNIPVRIEGAYGKFQYQLIPQKRQIWIGGGIGITPFLSMIHNFKSGDYQIDLYYSVKNHAEFIDYSNIVELAKSRGFRFIPIDAEKNGILNGKTIHDISGDLTHAAILICGPPPMMKALRKHCVELGAKNANIYTEEFAMS